jgi:tetratricopeptide (TPR) repeat protein
MRKTLLLLLLGLLTGCLCYSRPGDDLATLQNAAPTERVSLAHKMYNDRIIHLDSVNAMASLSRILHWAEEKNDIPLKVFSLMAMGDYHKEMYSAQEKTALQYFTIALELATAHNLKELEAELFNNMGWLFYQQNKFPQAFEYMIKANNIIQNEIGYAHYSQSGRYLYDLGSIYYDFGNYEKAKQYLKDATKYPFTSQVYAIRIYNTLGLAYREMEVTDSATVFFQKALDIAKAIHHVAWTGVVSGNLGANYYMFKKYDMAVPLLTTDYVLSVQSGEWTSAANTLCMLADIDMERRDMNAAKARLEEANIIMKREKDNKAFLLYALKKAKYFRLQHRYDSAFLYVDTGRKIQYQLKERQSSMVFSQAEQKVAVERHLAEMKVLETQKSKSALVHDFIIVVILLCLVIAGQFIYRLQLKHKKDKELLNDAAARLNYYIESVREKNEMIDRFKQEIEYLNALPENNIVMVQEREEIADKLKKYTILTEDHWNEFRHLFEKVQKGFFDKLKQKYPELTPAEQRLLALLKLKLSRREMAVMLGIATDSIKKARQRIRRKINVQDDDELEELVDSL